MALGMTECFLRISLGSMLPEEQATILPVGIKFSVSKQPPRPSVIDLSAKQKAEGWGRPLHEMIGIVPCCLIQRLSNLS